MLFFRYSRNLPTRELHNPMSLWTPFAISSSFCPDKICPEYYISSSLGAFQLEQLHLSPVSFFDLYLLPVSTCLYVLILKIQRILALSLQCLRFGLSGV